MFLFKHKKVVVDCFINDPSIAKLYPIKKSIHHVPKWWNDLEHNVAVPTEFGVDRPSPTMKTCTGFVYFFRDSWTLPLWTDIIVVTDKEGTYRYLCPRSMGNVVAQHPRYQYMNGFNDRIHIKFNSPWRLCEKTGIRFVMMAADWTLIDKLPDIRVLPGFLNFKYLSATNINCFFPLKDAEYKFEAGTPMTYLIPLTDKKVELKTQVVTEVEYEKVTRQSSFYMNTFINGLQKWKSRND
jgi:hypothetical protein